MNGNAKEEILRMFSAGRGSAVQETPVGANGGSVGQLVLREVVELLAPVFWVTSLTRLVDAVRQVFMFAVGVFGFYMVFHWLLTGVPSSWWLAVQVPLALLGVMVALVGVVK